MGLLRTDESMGDGPVGHVVPCESLGQWMSGGLTLSLEIGRGIGSCLSRVMFESVGAEFDTHRTRGEVKHPIFLAVLIA